VAHSLAPSTERRLVIDIGGGSTEFIIGTGLEPELMESIPMGCVSYSLRYFPDGSLEKSCFKRAELAAANELQRIVDAYRRTGWKQVVASSGTAKSLASMLRASGYCEQGISAAALDKLRAQFIKAGEGEKLDLAGLREDRVAIIPGGLAIMSAVLSEFGIEQIDVSDGALRQGVLYDLAGRVRHRDMREATVRQFMRRYQVDTAQAERVGKLAQDILAGLDPERAEADAAMMRWRRVCTKSASRLLTPVTTSIRLHRRSGRHAGLFAKRAGTALASAACPSRQAQKTRRSARGERRLGADLRP